MRALIIGASGAVGSAVARRAHQRGVDVQAAVRPGSDLRRLPEPLKASCSPVNLSSARAVASVVESARADWVLMAAFPAHQPTVDAASLRSSMQANARGLLEGLVRAGFTGAVTWVGSSMAYHHAEPGRSPSRPLSVRGAIKFEESRLVAGLAREHSLPLTELRLFTGYGPFEQPERLVPALLRAALAKERVRIATQGTSRDWLHFEDFADACLASAAWREARPRVLAACSGQVHDALAVARLLERISGRPLIDPGAFDRQEPYGDSHAGTPPSPAQLAWRPRFDLQAGLEQYWRWANTPAGRNWLMAWEPACA